MKCSKIRHSGIQVANMERSIKFYTGIGFKVSDAAYETWQGKRLYIIKMEAEDGNKIELVQGPWRAHICLEVDNIEAYPIMKETSSHRVTFIEDPDFNRIELFERKAEQ
jgi:catechol 2,3-dioxygenase-like lactoylglutathione lyase family enzyme